MTTQPNILATLEAFYIEYFNDYLTVECMAEHKGLTVEQTSTLIMYGKEIHLAKHGAHCDAVGSK